MGGKRSVKLTPEELQAVGGACIHCALTLTAPDDATDPVAAFRMLRVARQLLEASPVGATHLKNIGLELVERGTVASR
jgi:hypothetical protein